MFERGRFSTLIGPMPHTAKKSKDNPVTNISMSNSTQNSNSRQNPADTAVLLERIELLLALHENQSTNGSSGIEQLLEAKTAEIIDSIEREFEIRFGQLENRIEQLSHELGSNPTKSPGELRQLETGTQPPPKNSAPESCASHWQQQKEAMLLKYGIDEDHRPSMDLDDVLATTPSTSQSSIQPPPAAQLPTAQSPETQKLVEEPTSASIPKADAESIKKLKDSLNAKLRDAEVELSIGRAKISQQQAELSERQAELDRRASLIEEKFAAIAQPPTRKVGFFKKLWIHLKPKHPEVNDRA